MVGIVLMAMGVVIVRVSVTVLQGVDGGVQERGTSRT